MEQSLKNTQQLHKQKFNEQTQSQSEADTGSRCHNCGAIIELGQAFCSECGAPQGSTCRHCGAKVKPNMAICPVCGKPITTCCTYCGSPMNAGEAFCPECGNPRNGITCPECGTLNFRSFCRKCNHPLNPMALYAVEQAKKDPRYIKAKAIAQELQDMEDEMEALQNLIAQEQTKAQEKTLDISNDVSDETRRLLEEFEKLSGTATSPKPQAKPEEPKPVKTEEYSAPELTIAPTTPDIGDIGGGSSSHTFSDATARLEQIKQKYAAKVKEFQSELDAMIPDPSDPPEIKRNFACARMITTTSHSTKQTKEIVRIAWVCNECGVRHNNPSECCFEEYGGNWITKEITKTISTITTGSSSFNL